MSQPDSILAAEWRTLRQMLRGQVRSGSHAARLQAFYAPQAAHYDRFRERLLHGREELIANLELQPGQYVVELGAGTGRNVDYYASHLPGLASVTLVDLCPALLEVAYQRTLRWPHCVVVEADATRYRPTQLVDRVYLSYALTMMPEWPQVLANAHAMLREDGLIGVVDFYVSATQPAAGMVRHNGWTRRLWPWWFAHDGVRLSGAGLTMLRDTFDTVYLREGMAPVPYLPGLRVPYFVFVGRRR